MSNIISISGMPVSGKSTTIKKIIQILEEKGYDPNQIHLVSTGQEFRTYFNFIIDLMKNVNNISSIASNYKSPKIKELLEDINFRKALINAIVEIRKSGYKIENFNVEQANNLESLKDLRYIIDTKIDNDIKKLGEQIQAENSEDFWIIDSRLAFHNIPSSFSVRLVVNEDVAAKRLLADSSRGKEDNNYKNEKEAKQTIKKRREGEVKRYLERYNVDLEDLENYDLIVDTSYSNIDDIANVILACFSKYKNNQHFGKMWGSPKKFLPLQTERDTLGKGFSMNMTEMLDSIKNNGYLPEEEIETIEVDGKLYIIEGHHRNFGAALSSKTLIPYNIIAKDDETIKEYGNLTARERAENLDSRYLKGHEWMLGEKFSYDQIYPDIYNELEQGDSR